MSKALVPIIEHPNSSEGLSTRPYYKVPQYVKDSVLAHIKAGYRYRMIAQIYNISISTISLISRVKPVNDTILLEHIDNKKIIKLKTLQNKAIDQAHKLYDGTYNPNVIECLATIDRVSQELTKLGEADTTDPHALEEDNQGIDNEIAKLEAQLSP
jgi:hypothetical protein